MTKAKKPRSDSPARSPGYCIKCGEPVETGQYYHHARTGDNAGKWWHCASGCCTCDDPHLKSDRAGVSMSNGHSDTSANFQGTPEGESAGDTGEGSAESDGSASGGMSPIEVEALIEGLENGETPSGEAAEAALATPGIEDELTETEMDKVREAAGMDGGKSEFDGDPDGEGADPGQSLEELMEQLENPTGTPAVDSMLEELGVQDNIKKALEALKSEIEKRAQDERRTELAQQKKEFTDSQKEKIGEAVEQALEEAMTPIEVTLPEQDEDGQPKKKVFKTTHYLFPYVMHVVLKQLNVYLYGPPGGGKSTIVKQVAQAMGRRYAYVSLSPQTPESKLVGYRDAQGKVVQALLADFWTNGGVFCIDELDNMSPGLAVMINTMMDSDEASLPAGMVEKHPEFVLVCCGNTAGTGADWLFPGRRKFDGAFRERFVAIPFEYDEKLETAMVKHENGNGQAKVWTKWVRDVRKFVATKEIPLVVSPRAAKNGARFLAPPRMLTVAEIADWCVFKGSVDDTTKKQVLQNVPLPNLPLPKTEEEEEKGDSK